MSPFLFEKIKYPNQGISLKTLFFLKPFSKYFHDMVIP
jgi:hypothetical protein